MRPSFSPEGRGRFKIGSGGMAPFVNKILHGGQAAAPPVQGRAVAASRLPLRKRIPPMGTAGFLFFMRSGTGRLRPEPIPVRCERDCPKHKGDVTDIDECLHIVPDGSTFAPNLNSIKMNNWKEQTLDLFAEILKAWVKSTASTHEEGVQKANSIEWRTGVAKRIWRRITGQGAWDK